MSTSRSLGGNGSRKTNARLLVADVHRLLAETLGERLALEGFEVDVPQPASTEAVLEVTERTKPDLVLLEPEGRSVPASLSLVRVLTEQGTSVLILTSIGDRILLAESLEAGAVGIAGKSESYAALVSSINVFLSGLPVINPGERHELLTELRMARTEREVRFGPFERLTPRERDVLRALGRGRQAAQIADESFVSIATVRSQIRSVLLKLGVNSQLAAVALAHQSGWLAS